jgi:hypothetical protein
MDQNTNFKRKQVSGKRMSIWGRVVGPNRLDALQSWLLVRRWIDEH